MTQQDYIKYLYEHEDESLCCQPPLWTFTV